MNRCVVIAIITIAFSLVVQSKAPAEEALTIAAASDVQRTIREIADMFEKTGPVKVKIVAGATGKLYTQITQGAPFHVFVSADVINPKRLEEKGLLSSYAPFSFSGSLVAWTGRTDIIDIIGKKDLDFLKDPSIRRIAIANPDIAPYGKAAFDALENSGVLARVRDKLVYGENVSQAFNFAMTGNADIALVSLATVYGQGGGYFAIDGRYHLPITQQAVVLKNAPRPAKDFLDFLRTDEALSIFRKYGYRTSSAPYHGHTAMAHAEASNLCEDGINITLWTGSPS